MADADTSTAAPAATAPAPAAAAPVAAAPAPVAAPAAAPAEAPLTNLFADNPDVKPAEGDKPAEEAKEGDKTAPDYSALKIPEGLELSPEAIASLHAELTKVNASPEAAQLLFDKLLDSVKATHDSGMKLWTDMQKGWQDQVRADPEIGGAKLDQNVAATRKGAEALLGEKAAKELFEGLNITGAGNHPGIVRALYKAFGEHSPATSVQGNPAAPAPAPRTAGQTLYPTQAGLGNAGLNP
jgi:hypothetical protein